MTSILPWASRVLLLSAMLFCSACATSRPPAREVGVWRRTTVEQWTAVDAQPVTRLPVGLRELPEGYWQFLFPPRPSQPAPDVLSLDEVRPFLAALAALEAQQRPRFHLIEQPGLERASRGEAALRQSRLRSEFLSRFGPPPEPFPEPLALDRLLLALQHSPRYMGEGIREAAIALFSSPAFVFSVCLSIVVYFAAWLAPEPLFSKAFAATLTLRLSLAVGLVELGQLARTGLLLYQEAQAATTPQELEAASERFGKAMGGASLRVLVTVASLGLTRFIPQVPEEGLWRLLPSVTPEGFLLLETSVATSRLVANSSIVVSGLAAGTAACSSLAHCSVNAAEGASGGDSRLSTRYGQPHTRENPAHNEAIERELASREAAGHTSLRKDRVQRDAAGERVYDVAPQGGVRFRRPDASSVRPDGVRHNTNYVSNPQDLKRELEAFDAMKRADPDAIHELYRLDGTLVSRYVPTGVEFP